MVTLKCVTNRGQTIEWNYDTPQQARHAWACLIKGETPDTRDPISRAYYFGPSNKPGDGPDKAWHA